MIVFLFTVINNLRWHSLFYRVDGDIYSHHSDSTRSNWVTDECTAKEMNNMRKYSPRNFLVWLLDFAYNETSDICQKD